MVSKSTLALLAAVAALGAASPAFAQDANTVPLYHSQRGAVIVHRGPLYNSTVTPDNWTFDSDGSAAARGNSH
jgi:ABC-type sugar transport system substrate-binding protein